MNRPAWLRTALVLAIAAVYFGAAKFGLSMAFVAEQVTLVWPPTGIALAATLLFGSRVWIGIFLGAFLANVTANEPFATAAGIAAGNTAEAIVGAWLLRRGADFDVSLSRLGDVVRLVVFAGMGATMISATVGATSLCLGGVQPWSAFSAIWRDWWLGDAIGAVVFAPLILTWRDVVRVRPAPRRVAEAAVLCAGLVAANWFVYGGLGPGANTEPLEYLVFPFLICAALRFGQPGATAVCCIVATIAIRATLRGDGPFRAEDVHQGLALLQLFVGVVAVTGLFLGAAIGERNRATQALRESDERFRFLADTIPSMVWTATPDGTLLYVNRRWVEYCGMSEEELARRWPAAVVHPDDVARRVAAWDAALRDGRQYVVEVRKRRRDGEYRWFITRGVPRKDAEGRVLAWFGVTTDIHDQKVLQEELREADRRKDEFLATLAHELRSPLAPIANALQLLRVAEGDPEVRRGAIDAADRQLRHMVRLVDDLLDVARVTRGEIPLRTERTDLASLVARAVESGGSEIAARGQRLSLSLPEAPVPLDADPTRIAQVLANLLQNAAKFSEPSAEIRLSAVVRSEGERNREVVVTVADSGIGIPPEVLPRIFDPFVQAGHSIGRSPSGLGLGLTLVKRLVELHGGTVGCRSDGVGKGSEFIVRLPLPDEGPRETTPRPRGGPVPHVPLHPSARRRVLVVDDDPDSATTMSLLLRRQGHDVRTAHDGPGAVDAASEFGPDVALLDIGLPGMNGYEVARRIRALRDGDRIVLIAVTGWGQAEDRRRSREAGFDRHLVKPVDHAELERLIARAGARSRRAPEAAARARPPVAAPAASNAEFVARMSHEVRTPLSAVVGAALLLADSDLLPEQRELVRKLRSSAESLRATLDDHADLADLESGTFELDAAPFRPSAAVDECLALLAADAAERGVELSCHVDDSVPGVLLGDAGRWGRVLVNVLRCALGACDRGEVSAEVSCRRRPGGRAELEVAVGDRGRGTVADALDRGAAGTGPSVARAICERSGGRTWIERGEDRGAQFRFTFVAAFPAGSASAEADDGDGPDSRPMRALVVDDDAFARTLARRLLESSGCTVDEAGGGPAALEALRRTGYDAVVIDLRMAGMDGRRTVEEMRRLPPRARRLVVVAATASSLPSDREALLAAGADVVLTKPLDGESLRSAIGCPAPPAADEDARAALDPGVLGGLRSIRGRDGRLVTEELVGLFLDDTPGLIGRIRDAAARRDARDLDAAIHLLRGNCASVGARRLSSVATEIESLLRAGDVAGAAAIVERVEGAWLLTRDSLARERSR